MTDLQIRQLMAAEIAEKSSPAHPVDTAPPSLDDDIDCEDNFLVDVLDRWGDRRVPKPHF